jgi:hypothetical protein
MKIVTLWSLLVCIMPIAVPAPSTPVMSAVPIQIRVLNAKNGERVKNQKVSVAIKGEKWAKEYVTDAEGNINVDLDPAAQIVASTEWWVTCRTMNPAAPHWFSVGDITSEGVTDENTCGKANSETIKGKLVIFARKASFGELFAK